MNEAAPKIEIFKPFGEAFELMNKILFQPFDIKKWCVIGFAAFLAGHFGGGFNFPLPFGNFRATRTQQNLPHFTAEQWRPWLPLIIFGFFVFILVFIIVVTCSKHVAISSSLTASYEIEGRSQNHGANIAKKGTAILNFSSRSCSHQLSSLPRQR